MSPKGWAKADRIQGWFTREEAELLARLCTGLWCEIGCHKGRSTLILAESGHDGYAIDTWLGSPEMPQLDSFSEFQRNLGQYENVIIARHDFRTVPDWFVPAKLQLLHLDADHSYEMTKLAFELYAPKVIQGGHVAFHDAERAGWPDVEQFVSELPPEWEHVETAFSLAAYKRQ